MSGPSTPTPTVKARLATAVLGRPVEEFIRERRDAGSSWRLVAVELRDATDGEIDVTGETLRAWCPELTEAGQAG